VFRAAVLSKLIFVMTDKVENQTTLLSKKKSYPVEDLRSNDDVGSELFKLALNMTDEEDCSRQSYFNAASLSDDEDWLYFESQYIESVLSSPSDDKNMGMSMNIGSVEVDDEELMFKKVLEDNDILDTTDLDVEFDKVCKENGLTIDNLLSSYHDLQFVKLCKNIDWIPRSDEVESLTDDIPSSNFLCDDSVTQDDKSSCKSTGCVFETPCITEKVGESMCRKKTSWYTSTPNKLHGSLNDISSALEKVDSGFLDQEAEGSVSDNNSSKKVLKGKRWRSLSTSFVGLVLTEIVSIM